MLHFWRGEWGDVRHTQKGVWVCDRGTKLGGRLVYYLIIDNIPKSAHSKTNKGIDTTQALPPLTASSNKSGYLYIWRCRSILDFENWEGKKQERNDH